MAKIDISIQNKMATSEANRRTRAYGADGHRVCERLADLMGSIAEGRGAQSLSIQIDNGNATDAQGTLTGSSVVATNTAQVGNQTFTASATPSGNNQFLVGISDAATMANLAAKINAHPALIGVVSASVLSAVVTVKAAHYGSAGNMIQLVGSTDIVASGSGYLAGGAEASANSYIFGGNL